VIWIFVAIAVAVVLLLALVLLYNRLVRLRNRTENAWAQVDVQLRRRSDLIPNLVKSVQGYAQHERELFEEVTRARAASAEAKGVEEQARAENAITSALGRLFAVAEAYPQLRATENFQQLQAELTNTEDQIAGARRIYNGNVQTYNTRIQTFPGTVFAGMFGFEKREFFELDSPSDRDVPSVSFGSGPGQVAPGPQTGAPAPDVATPPPGQGSPPPQ
jgi:LemA protein